MAKNPNRLSQEKVIKLNNWLIAHKATLETAHTTTKKIAKNASTDLGFTVADNSIIRMAKLANVTLAVPASTVSRRTTAIRKKVELVRDHLVLLYQKVGEPTPEDLGVNWPAEVT